MPAPKRPNLGPAHDAWRLKGGRRSTKVMRFTLPGELADLLEGMPKEDRDEIVERALKAYKRRQKTEGDTD